MDVGNLTNWPQVFLRLYVIDNEFRLNIVILVCYPQLQDNVILEFSKNGYKIYRLKRKYRKNTWLFEFENKHFPCFMSLYILKTEQKKTESIIKYEFFLYM